MMFLQLEDVLGFEKTLAKNLLYLKIISSLFYFKFLIIAENTNM